MTDSAVLPEQADALSMILNALFCDTYNTGANRFGTDERLDAVYVFDRLQGLVGLRRASAASAMFAAHEEGQAPSPSVFYELSCCLWGCLHRGELDAGEILELLHEIREEAWQRRTTAMAARHRHDQRHSSSGGQGLRPIEPLMGTPPMN